MPIAELNAMTRRKPANSLVRMLTSMPPAAPNALLDLDLHLHLRMDGALHLGLAGVVELDRRRLAGFLGLEIERHARRVGVDVVGDRILVREGHGFTQLDGDL